MSRPLVLVVKLSLIALASWAELVRAEKEASADSVLSDSDFISPSPRDYVDLYKRACQVAPNYQPSKHDLFMHYANQTAPGSQRLGRLLMESRLDRECRRELSAWRYRYIDEAGSVSIRDDSIDERLANVVYTTRAIKAFAIDSFMYDSGDKAVDASNMELAAGPQVDDRLCEQQLTEMLRLQEELGERNKRLASGRPVVLTDAHISLAKILDSFGRYAPGFLYGRTMSMGAFEQCRTSKLIVNQTSRLGMRYCWAHLGLSKHLDPSLKERQRDYLETETDVLSTGICIPESCHSKSFHKYPAHFEALVNSQFKLPSGLYVDETLPLDSIYCLVDEHSRFQVPLFGKLLLGCACLWLLATIIVTHCHRTRGARSREEGARRSLWANLDLLESWRDFQEARERADTTQLVELNAINPVKVLGSLFVVLAHSLALFIGFSMDEMHSAQRLEKDPVMLLMVCASLVVDTFFAISGILWAFFCLKRLHRQDDGLFHETALESGAGQVSSEETQFVDTSGAGAESAAGARANGDKNCKSAHFVHCDGARKDTRRPTEGCAFFFKNWLMLTIFRYLRITPLFVLVHWFKKFVFIYAGSGPLWDHGFNSRSFSGSCRQESMWTPFTFMSAYYPLSHQCTLQSWSISNDMFFAILAPPVIMLVYKRPRLAIWFSLIACSLSFMSAQRAIARTPSFIDEELRELRSWGFYRFFDKVSTLYTAPHYRIFCFLIGVWGGYFLHRLQLAPAAKQHQEQREPSARVAGRKTHWPWWMRGPGTWLSFGYLLLVLTAFIFNHFLKLHMDPYYRQIYPQFVTSIRFIWALSNTVIFLRMMTDWKDSFCMRLSSAKFWQLLTKLNYPILLVHMDLLVYTLQVARSPVSNVTVWAFINLGFGIFFVCIPISILLHVVYENPFDKLIRALLPKYLTTAAVGRHSGQTSSSTA